MVPPGEGEGPYDLRAELLAQAGEGRGAGCCGEGSWGVHMTIVRIFAVA